MKLRNREPLIGRHSLFRRYFFICSACVIASITVLGVILLFSFSDYFEKDKYSMMENNVGVAAQVTARNYVNNNYAFIDINMIEVAYFTMGNAIEAEFFLVNLKGEVVYSQGSFSGVDYSKILVPQDVLGKAQEGTYVETGNFQNIYTRACYIVGVPVVVEDQPIAVLFAACRADDLIVFLKEMAKMFVFSAIVVLAFASVLISFLTGRMVRPLQQMLAATQSFSQGDFSKRVPVSGYDEIGQLSMAFNNMASTLSTTETSRRSFIANVSHELKTPMTTIGGFVDGILDGTVPEEKRDQYLQVVSNEVKRLARLVRSMLDTARIEAGELQVNPVAFDISETIRQTIFTFEQAIEEKQLEIRGLEEDRVMVLADRDLMHQVVYNLVENAVKFVNPGGYIEFRYRSDGRRTYVCIRNSGAGLDREEAPMLFDRFYKSDKSRSLNKSGVGLGLHIVRSIINYHKGEIVVRSAEGEFTEFEFAIPAPDDN